MLAIVAVVSLRCAAPGDHHRLAVPVPTLQGAVYFGDAAPLAGKGAQLVFRPRASKLPLGPLDLSTNSSSSGSGSGSTLVPDAPGDYVMAMPVAAARGAAAAGSGEVAEG